MSEPFVPYNDCLYVFSAAATELGTNQWLGALLQGAGVSGILVLVFINGLMAVGALFAGPLSNRANPNGMLILRRQPLADLFSVARWRNWLCGFWRCSLFLQRQAFVFSGLPCWICLQNAYPNTEPLVFH